MNIVALFESNVRKSPDKPMLRYAGRSHTYAEVDDQARRAAAVFAGLGVGPGDRVAVMCFNTPGFVAAMLGAWRLGAVVVPVNHKMQAPEVDYILGHCGARVCVFDGALAPVAARLEAPALLLATGTVPDGYRNFDALLIPASPAQTTQTTQTMTPADDDLAEILYTSGTTGRPKGCLLSHRSVCMAAMTAALALSMTRDERTLVAMPLWHSSPLNNWFLGTLYVGGTVILLREYHPLHFLEAVQDERATLYFGAPVSYLLPLQAGLDVAAFDLGSIRAWIYGGGPIGADTARQLAAAYRSDRFFQVFGMTETGPSGTVLYPEEQIAKAGSIGRVATPGVDMRVVRQDGGDAGPGDIGEIWLRADSVMQGYLDNEAATREVLQDGWYRSGDLVRRDEDGFLFIVDRARDMIITGGENVYSKEVEDVLLAHPDIRDAAVIGRPHAEWGETVIAMLVVRGGAQLDADALEVIKAFVAERLARYKVPREFLICDQLPRTPTGKLMKHLLRAA
ncbi:Long-chain-fatty-acid--CoA ligase [compost metagenome]